MKLGFAQLFSSSIFVLFKGIVIIGEEQEQQSVEIEQSKEQHAVRYSMDGGAQVLVALEKMEQDEELTYEHRGMRMDIDSMSYEELLALEERMGSVSTALSEEALSKCIEKNIYQAMSSEIG